MKKQKLIPTFTEPTIEYNDGVITITGEYVQIKVDKGDWMYGCINLDGQQHTIFARSIVNDTYSNEVSETFSVCYKVISKIDKMKVSYTIHEGWNLLPVSVQIPDVYNASDLLRSMGFTRNVTIVRKVPNGYETYVYGRSFNDFPIDVGHCYFVYSEEEITVDLTGIYLTTMVIRYYEGWNLLSSPYIQDVKASDIINNNPGIVCVGKKIDNEYITSVNGLNDFDISYNDALIVYAENGGEIRV